MIGNTIPAALITGVILVGIAVDAFGHRLAAVVTDVITVVLRIGMIAHFCVALVTGVILVGIFALGHNLAAVVAAMITISISICMIADRRTTAMVTAVILIRIRVFADCYGTTVITDMISVGIFVGADGFGTAIITLVIQVAIVMLAHFCITIITVVIQIGICAVGQCLVTTIVTDVIAILLSINMDTGRRNCLIFCRCCSCSSFIFICPRTDRASVVGMVASCYTGSFLTFDQFHRVAKRRHLTILCDTTAITLTSKCPQTGFGASGFVSFFNKPFFIPVMSQCRNIRLTGYIVTLSAVTACSFTDLFAGRFSLGFINKVMSGSRFDFFLGSGTTRAGKCSHAVL